MALELGLKVSDDTRLAVPIAMLVPRVTLPKRLDVEELVMGRVSALMKGIELGIAGIR